MRQFSPTTAWSMTQLAKISVPAPMLRIGDDAVGPDLDARRQMYLADEHGIDVDEYVAPDLDVAANVDARRVGQRGAGEHQFLGALIAR